MKKTLKTSIIIEDDEEEQKNRQNGNYVRTFRHHET